MKKHLELLGKQVVDDITGLEGVATSVSFDLCGCTQVLITPPVNAEGKPGSRIYVDITRATVTSEERVMPLPDFVAGYIAEGKKGPAEKPVM